MKLNSLIYFYIIISEEDNDDSEFNTCLKFVIKSKLEKDGIILKPGNNGEIEEYNKWENSLDDVPENNEVKNKSASSAKKKIMKKK